LNTKQHQLPATK